MLTRLHRFDTLRITLLLAAALALLGVSAAPAAAAKIKVSATMVKGDTGTKIQVTLTSASTPSSKKRPRSVTVKAARKTVRLKRVGASAAAGYSSTWASKNFTGSYANKLNALNGKRVKATVKSRSGATVSHPKAALQTAGGGGGGGTTPIFASPGRDLIGNEAFNYLSKYFLNSAFSDCAAGYWPYCAVEHRYVHCPNYKFGYELNSGSDADVSLTFYPFTVTGANVYADGSWAVSYTVSTGAGYVWRVNPYGVASGEYYWGGSMEPLTSYYWSQPAITWLYTNGAC